MKAPDLLNLAHGPLRFAAFLMLSSVTLTRIATAEDYVFTAPDSTLNADFMPAASTMGTGNTVTLSGFLLKDDTSIYGVYESDLAAGELTGNQVSITACALKDIYGAYCSGGASTNNNTVKVTLNLDSKVPVSSTIHGKIYGGSATTGNANGNEVSLLSATTNGKIFGGYSESGAADGNTVTFLEGVHTGIRIYGGYTESATSGGANNNSIVIHGSSLNFTATETDTSYVIGGYSGYGATGNSVTIRTSHLITATVYGGSAINHDANNNTVILNARTLDDQYINTPSYLKGSVKGGRSSLGNSVGNTVNIVQYVIENSVYGGYSGSRNATNNELTVSDSTLTGTRAYGGYANGNSGIAAGNKLTITNSEGTNDGNVFFTGGYSGYQTINNSVLLDNSSVTANIRGGDTGNAADVYGTSSGNSVTVRNGSVVDGYIHGGRTFNDGATMNNTVTVTDSTLNSSACAGRSESGNVYDNELLISHSVANKNIYGGRANAGNATGNTVTVLNSTAAQNIYGGYSASGTATGNNVILRGTANNLSAAGVYGGFSEDAAADARTGNTLTLDGFKGEAAGVYNVETIRFNIGEWDHEGVTLSITNKDLDISGMNFNVTLNNNSLIEAGSAMTLISGLNADDAELTNLIAQNAYGADLTEDLQLSVILNAETYDLVLTAVNDIAAVPEPSTASLGISALLALMMRRRRR